MNDEIKIKREFLSTVYIIRDGKVLMTFNKKIKKFIPLGGHINEDELPCNSVIREAKEESGYDIELIDGIEFNNKNIPQPINIHLDIIKPDHHHINIGYVGRIIGGEEHKESDEGTELRWFSQEEIEKDKEILENIKESAIKAIKILNELEGK